MTIQNFYRALRRLAARHTFYLTKDGKIRVKIKGKSCCPLTAIYYDRTGNRINIQDANSYFIC
jgi:hypothetical protein